MRNAIGAADKTPLTTTWPACPAWCTDHQDVDLKHGPGNAFRVHRGTERTAPLTGDTAQLARADTLGEGFGFVTVVFGDRDLAPDEAQELVDLLLETLAGLETGR